VEQRVVTTPQPGDAVDQLSWISASPAYDNQPLHFLPRQEQSPKRFTQLASLFVSSCLIPRPGAAKPAGPVATAGIPVCRRLCAASAVRQLAELRGLPYVADRHCQVDAEAAAASRGVEFASSLV